MRTKRVFDVAISVIGLLILLPFLVLAAIFIKLESRGPIIYSQRRVGLNETHFYIYKFRTMVVEAEQKGLPITSSNDRRITRVGKLLRKIKLDEMPQLINILKGNMSLVGPRPEVSKYVQFYTDEQKKVLTIKPGMTDPATVFFRNEEELLAKAVDKESFYINEIMPIKLKLYLQYVENASLLYDIKLIFMEILAIIFPQSMIQKVFPRAIGIQATSLYDYFLEKKERI